MKTMLKLKSVLFTLIILCSCENNFDPKGEFEEIFSLYLIIDADTSYQVATLKSSFDSEGFDPFDNLIDPSVTQESIQLLSGNEVFNFRDSTINNNGEYRYDNQIPFYYLNNFKPEPRQEINLLANLSNGTVLKSKVKTPDDFRIFLSTSTTIVTDQIDDIIIQWAGPNSESFKDDFFFSRLLLHYYKKEGNDLLPFTEEIPIQFVKEVNGELSPVFPRLSQQLSFQIYKVTAVNEILRRISEGDSNKSNYFIEENIIAEVNAVNKDLAIYISSIETFEDGFTIKTQAPLYTNIEGGHGIFGIFRRREFPIKVKESLVSKFGYNLLENDSNE